MKTHITAVVGRGAIVAAALFAAAFSAPPASASPPLPTSPDITPGIGLATYNATGTDGSTCTAGFLAHTKSGQQVMLSAGHCDEGGKVAMNWSGTGAFQTVGTFTRSIDQGNVGEDTDVGLIGLDTTVPVNSRIFDIRPVTGVTSDLKVGQKLCKFGVATGLTCGPITNVTDSKVSFAATGGCRDSGSPVYFRHSDGTATAVGIAIRKDLSCDVPGDSITAELVQPWLQRWGLTLDTPPRPGASPVGAHGQR